MFESVSLEPVLSWLPLALIAAALIGLLFLQPAFGGLNPGRRRTLFGLRAGVVGLALLALLRPGCVSTVESRQSAQLRILLDESRSGELPHQNDRSRRWDVVRQMLESNRAALVALEEARVEVSWETFSGQLESAEIKDGLPVLGKDPTGAESDIAGALFQSMRNSRDKRVIGVVLASDGVQNSATMPVDINEAIAATRAREIPVYAIPLGLPSGIGETADVAISNLPDHHTVAVRNRLAVRATLNSRGFANQPLTVQLAISRAGQAEQIVDTQLVTPTSAGEQQTVELKYIPPEPGQYRMTVRAVPMPGEIALRNNELTSFLSVEEGGLRVLLIVGSLGNEQIFLRRAIPSTSQGIDLEFLEIYPDNQANWPVGEAYTRLLADPSNDVIILMDLDSRALFKAGVREENIAALEQHVARGKGLLMMGGDHSFGPGLWHSTPLADVLPVLMNKSERQEFGSEVDRSAHIDRPLKLVPVEEHFLTRLSGDGATAAAWERLPPLICANRFARMKDNAELLLASEAGEAVMVAGSYGAGRVVAFAGDSTWRWWTKGYQEEYKTFWRQLLYWLAFRDGQSNDLVRIEMPQRRFQPESTVSFSAEAWTSTGSRIADASFSAWLINPAGERTEIPMTRSGTRDWAEPDRELFREPGVYSVHVRASRGGQTLGESGREFSISDSDREKSNPMADHEFLQRIAGQTSEFGGRMVPTEEFGSLLAGLARDLPDLQVKVPVKWKLGQSPLDSSVFLLAFVGLLGTDWFLRKRWGLV